MKRLHLHVSVRELAESIQFYSTLFGAQPTVIKDDYAKWMLDDPRVNFAVSQRGRAAGVDHVGIQVETAEELAEITSRLKAAGEHILEQEATTCCYAKSDKAWVEDPAGLKWESFFSFGEDVTYGEDHPALNPPDAPADAPKTSACCGA